MYANHEKELYSEKARVRQNNWDLTNLWDIAPYISEIFQLGSRVRFVYNFH